MDADDAENEHNIARLCRNQDFDSSDEVEAVAATPQHPQTLQLVYRLYLQDQRIDMAYSLTPKKLVVSKGEHVSKVDVLGHFSRMFLQRAQEAYRLAQKDHFTDESPVSIEITLDSRTIILSTTYRPHTDEQDAFRRLLYIPRDINGLSLDLNQRKYTNKWPLAQCCKTIRGSIEAAIRNL